MTGPPGDLLPRGGFEGRPLAGLLAPYGEEPSGDSAAPKYRDLIAMHECRAAKQLAAVIDGLLPV